MEKIWMRNWPDYMPEECVYPHGEIPVFEYLRKNAGLFPEKAAMIYYGRRVSFREFDEASEKFANYLIGCGMKKGDRVGLYMGNCPQYVIAHFGIQKMGGVVCPINPLFKEMELKYQINDAGMSAVVTIDLNIKALFNIKAELPSVKKIVYTNFNDFLGEEPELPLLDYMKIQSQPIEGADYLMDILESQSSERVDVEVGMGDLALFEYTGGSTGLPKGAMHTHTSHLFKPLAFSVVRQLNVDTIELSPMPFFHIAGMDCMLGNIIAGSTSICMVQFDPLAACMAVDRYQVTHMYTAVPMNVQIMRHPEVGKYDLSSLKTNLTTSFIITLNDDIAKKWSQLTGGCTLVEAAYGLSETHTADTFMPQQKVKYGSVGIPIYDTEIKILDPADRNRAMPAGEQGEIAVKTKGLMAGYWNKPEETEKSFHDGFLLTGDIGKFDEDGYLYWLGRLKEMIKVSGHSVFPEEVEMLINQHEGVLESAVIPVKDDKKGEVVKAFVVLRPDIKGELSSDELRLWARENMTPHKVPAYVEFRDQLPKSGVKLLRRILRDEEEQKLSAGV